MLALVAHLLWSIACHIAGVYLHPLVIMAHTKSMINVTIHRHTTATNKLATVLSPTSSSHIVMYQYGTTHYTLAPSAISSYLLRLFLPPREPRRVFRLCTMPAPPSTAPVP